MKIITLLLFTASLLRSGLLQLVICYKLSKQLATSLWQLATYLSRTSCRKLCERILISTCCNNLLQHVGRLVANCAFLKHSITVTHVKMSQLATSLQTSRQQDVFALLVPSCQQVVPNLLTTCNKLDENTRLVTRLF